MSKVIRDGVSIDYAVDGDPGDPSVLLLAGLGYGRWMWRWLTAALADEYEVIRPDNRGTGESDVPEGPYTIDELAADAAAVLDDHGVDRVHVCGASMGGMTAQSLALADDRVASLTLLCTSPGGEGAVETPADVREHIFDPPEDADPRERIRYLMEPAVSDGFYGREPELVEEIVSSVIRTSWVAVSPTAATGIRIHTTSTTLNLGVQPRTSGTTGGHRPVNERRTSGFTRSNRPITRTRRWRRPRDYPNLPVM
ncbi:alpha/beta fold hydrolase [Halorubrum tibetense]|uniref:Alpha/beta fold hydrolase n=1 Tax=Halorubrum tibetense TaxID=175631 RepID=A0ABD5S7N3_9EURY